MIKIIDSDQLIVINNNQEDNEYCNVPLNCIENEQLSWKAKGIYYYLVSRSEDWETYHTNLLNVSTDREISLTSGIRELIKHHYIYRTFRRGTHIGNILIRPQWGYIILSSPLPENQIEKFLVEDWQIYNSKLPKKFLDIDVNKINIPNTKEYIKELRLLPYKKYLLTEHWQKIREKILKRENYTCQKCRTKGGVLHVHHNTYEHRGYEYDEDLQVLCRTCHQEYHRIKEVI